MTGNPPFIQVTPFFGVAAMEAALIFYRDVLGFTVHVDGGGYAYVDVGDVDALFARLEPALATLPADRWGPPKDAPYGQREFWARDPDGNLITFGEGIGANAAQWDYRR